MLLILRQFFTRLGLPKLRFKPAYNPYTEPSMEIFSYSEQLKKWMEVRSRKCALDCGNVQATYKSAIILMCMVCRPVLP